MGDRKEAERERWRGVQWGGLKSHWSHGTNSVSSHNHCERDKRWMPVCRIATAYQWFIIDSDSASGFNTTGQLEHQECRSSWSPLYRCSFGLFVATSTKQSRAYCAVHHLSYSSLNSSFCFLFTSLFFSPMWCVLLHSQVVSFSSKSCRVPSLLCLYLSATIIISFHSYLHVHLLSFAHSYVGLDLHLILLKNRQYRLFSSTSSCLSGCVTSNNGQGVNGRGGDQMSSMIAVTGSVPWIFHCLVTCMYSVALVSPVESLCCAGSHRITSHQLILISSVPFRFVSFVFSFALRGTMPPWHLIPPLLPIIYDHQQHEIISQEAHSIQLLEKDSVAAPVFLFFSSFTVLTPLYFLPTTFLPTEVSSYLYTKSNIFSYI